MSKIYLLNNLPYEGVENLEVFDIEYIPSEIDLSKFDALIFTSKNAIYSIDSFNKEWKKIPAFAIAEKPGNIIKKVLGKLEFVGYSSHGDEFAKELIPILKNKKVLYIRAEKVVSNLVQIIKDNSIDISELITYRTICKKNLNQTIEDNSTIIFTSPSSIKCFFKNYKWNDTLKAIVIGKTTAKYLPLDINYEISNKTSIEECIKLAKMGRF